jgi:hypothetical protein
MTKQKNSRKQIVEIIMIIAIILCVGLIAVEMGSNLSTAITSQSDNTTNVETALPTPYPTLTAEELRESLSHPVNQAVQ